jgi:hypothetical protein
MLPKLSSFDFRPPYCMYYKLFFYEISDQNTSKQKTKGEQVQNSQSWLKNQFAAILKTCKMNFLIFSKFKALT